MNYLETLKEQFNYYVNIREKRPRIFQLVAPLYHEDGDMVDIFLETLPSGAIRVSDYGMTLMRLSYSFEIDTPNKERIFHQILSENLVQEENGNIFLESPPMSLYPSVLQFAQAIAKIGNMKFFKREMIQSLFYEQFTTFVEDELRTFNVRSDVLPMPERDDLEVDFELRPNSKPIFLFGVKDNAKARLVALSCLEFQRNLIPFKSYVVHQSFDDLSRKDRNRITSAVDKQFISLDDFRQRAIPFLEREISHT